jgi:F1F0 ATPase subunit 2
MTQGTILGIVAVPSAAALAGLAFGLLYFAALRWTVDFYLGARGWLVPVSLTLARIIAAVVVLALAARLGAAALFCVFLGFLAARALALRTARRTG